MNTLGYKKEGIAYIKSYFIIDLGSFKCSLGYLLLQTCNYFMSGWELLGCYDNAEKSLQKNGHFLSAGTKSLIKK